MSWNRGESVSLRLLTHTNLNTCICKKDVERGVSSWGRRRPGRAADCCPGGSPSVSQGALCPLRAPLCPHCSQPPTDGFSRPSRQPRPHLAHFSAAGRFGAQRDPLYKRPPGPSGAALHGSSCVCPACLAPGSPHHPLEVWPPRAHGLCVNDMLFQVLRATRI